MYLFVFDWFFGLSVSFVIGQSDNYGFMTLMKTALTSGRLLGEGLRPRRFFRWSQSYSIKTENIYVA